MFGSTWENGSKIAVFNAITNGPESSWTVEMRACIENGKRFNVVYDPFAERLMWFDNDRVGLFEARRAFNSLVELAMFDAEERKYA